MDLHEAISLIDGAVPLLPRQGQAQSWADLGCGTGVFTTAIARLLPADSSLQGIDTNPGFLQQTLPNGTRLIPIKADFEKDHLSLKDLDGILMANSLHYIKDKAPLIKKLRTYMQPGAPFLIVEYDTDRPVPKWVPYPLSFNKLSTLFETEGYTPAKKLGTKPSVYGRADLYAAFVAP